MKNELLEKQMERNRGTAAGFGGWAARVAQTLAGPNTNAIETNSGGQKSESGKRVILLVSHDLNLDKSLRTAARGQGHIVITAESLTGALRTARAACSQVALLDLDMDKELGWDIAEGLLRHPKCPPVVLMTGRKEQFDMKMAIESGLVVDKTSAPDQILQLIDRILEASQSALAERKSLERVVIRWLRPVSWPISCMAPHHRWGINE
jgi:CheY-like chemotaxis protein